MGAVGLKIATLLLVRKDPLRAEAVGRRLGSLLWLSKKHRNRALANLKLAFPELTDEQRLDITKRCFQHFGMLATDFFRTPYRSQDEFTKDVVYEGLEHLDKALAKDEGIVIVTGHLGNWERAGAMAFHRGFELYAVQRDANSGFVNRWMTEQRKKSGLNILSRGNAIRSILKLLHEKKAVTMLVDQNCSEVFVPFFGLPTGTVTGPALIHLRTGAPLIPAFCMKTGPNSFKAHIYPELTPDPAYEDPRVGLTAAMNAALEDIIRKYPEQWLWFHDRWKSARRSGRLPEE